MSPPPESILPLYFLEGVGLRRLSKAFRLADSWEAFCHLEPALLCNVGWPEATVSLWRKYLAAPASSELLTQAEPILDWHAKHGAACLSWFDSCYPEALRHIPDPPPALFCLGQTEYLSSPQVAIVGSRKATSGGMESAYQFAAGLSRQGYTVTSGFALGIDSQAHEGALAGVGSTIAVLGTGLDRLYPRQNRALREKIQQTGVLVTEYPVGSPPRREHFPQRNRIISGLASGVLVVEADIKSGSLITAKQALEQGREVFAIPGSIHNPMVRGCHQLIQQGAKLTTCVDDILSEISQSLQTSWPVQTGFSFSDSPTHLSKTTEPGSPSHSSSSLPAESLSGREQDILDGIGYEIRDVDDLAVQTGLSVAELMEAVCLLELKGMIQSVPGGYCRIRSG